MKDILDTDVLDAPGTVEWLGVRYRPLLRTPGLAIIDTWSPAGSGPPRHAHHDADETFVVLTGQVELWIDGARSTLGAGEAGMIPRGVEHTYRVTVTGPSRKLVLLTPGGFEGFFEAVAAGQFRIPDDMEAITRIAAEHHLTFTGPPLEP